MENGLGRASVPLAIALPKGWEALVRPRSGLALKEGLTILNTPGTIDENYRGEVCAIVCNTTSKVYNIKKEIEFASLQFAQFWELIWI